MSLRPTERHGKDGHRPRELNENEKNKLRREKEKADFYYRNPHLKWGDR